MGRRGRRPGVPRTRAGDLRRTPHRQDDTRRGRRDSGRAGAIGAPATAGRDRRLGALHQHPAQDPPRGADQRHRAAARRERRRQERLRPGNPAHQPQGRPAVPRSQLRRHTGAADGVRAVRRRARRLHRGDRVAAGALPARRRRHAVPRRDRHPVDDRAGQAAARHPERRVRIPGRPGHAQGRRADHRRDQRGPARRGPGRPLPRRPVLPAERLPHRHPPAARAPRRHPAASWRTSSSAG
ncbi:hypothetical protein D3C76_1071150 [compost metagenome]